MTAVAAASVPLQRGAGIADIGLIAGPGGARIARLYQRTPLRVLFPDREPDDIAIAALVTTSGGLAGGDTLSIAIDLGPDARAVVASQAAEKVYRSTGDETVIDVGLTVGADAWLEWVPQETILFDNARLRRCYRVSVQPTGRLLACDAFVLGRRARGERFTAGLLQDRWEVSVGGKLTWADALRIDDPASVLHRAGLSGAEAVATILYVGPDAPDFLALARASVNALPRAGATLVGGILLIRMIDRDASRLRGALAEIMAALRAEIGGLPRRVPRLWQC